MTFDSLRRNNPTADSPSADRQRRRSGSVVGGTPYSTLVVFVAVCAAWVLVLFTRAGRLPLEQKACLLGLTFMLASPLMHPWYPLSLLPFAIGGGGMATLWLAVSAHWTYDEVPQDVFIEYLPTYVWTLWAWMRGGAHGPFAIRQRGGEQSR